ncbi:MAG: transglutaminase domain-containing protein [Gracilibacteraceae bacterium]|jgi:transglutaminase-like putative cysteine protease|nr:transglutaminase domain-containing protein [Gracilibacteraceae bacterium]
MNKGILSLIIFVLLAGLCVAASSHELSAMPKTTFSLSCNPEENTTVVLQGKTLVMRNFSQSNDFDYIIIKLTGNQGFLSVKKSKNARKDTYDVKFRLHDVPKGTYTVEVYHASQKYAPYTSYTPGQTMQIKVHDSFIEFIEPLTFARNKAVFDANTSDLDTLRFYLQPSSKVESDDPSIVEQADAITAGASSDYSKAKAIHDWVAQNIWYDFDELNSGVYLDKTARETLVSQTGVCVDYASLTAALLRAVGIPAKLVTGYVLDTAAQEIWTQTLIDGNKSNHVWNEAYIEGRWIVIDTSYDSNNAFVNGRFSTGTGLKNSRYFDISIDLLSVDRYILQKHLDPLRLR